MKNILITDDEEIIRITLMEWFSTSKYDFNFLMAENGKDAVRVLSEENVDLLVTDLNMPKMDGFELLAFMNNNYPAVPIVVMSSFVSKDIKDKVAEMGAVQFLEKPLNFEALAEIDFGNITGGSSVGHVNGISLQSFLQLLSMENKTCTLTIESEGKTGIIYMENGVLLNAKTLTLDGEAAAYEIVTWQGDDLQIEIEYKCTCTEQKINFPIMHLLMESARLIDEKKTKKTVNLEDAIADNNPVEPPAPVSPPPPQPTPVPAPVAPVPSAPPVQEPAAPLSIEPEFVRREEPTPAQAPPPPASPAPNLQSPADDRIEGDSTIRIRKRGFTPSGVKSKLQELAEIDGFGGVALLDPTGEIIYKINGDNVGFTMDNVSILANIILLNSQKATRKMKTGDTRFIHLETDSNHIFIRCLNEAKDPLKTEPGKIHIHLVLVLTNSDSLGMAKMMINNAIEDLAE